jgi:phage protein D
VSEYDAISVTSEAECPYCTSVVTLTTDDAGRLTVHHHQRWEENCERQLRHMLAEVADEHGLTLQFPREN